MNRKEMIVRVSKGAGITLNQAAKALNVMINGLKESLKSGKRVTFSGFGSFEVKTRNARKGRNPKTGASVDIPAKKRVKFNPSKSFKGAL